MNARASVSQPDPLSDVLASVRLERADFRQVELDARWSSRHGSDGTTAAGTHRLACYQVLAGACVLEVAGEPARPLAPGMLALLTRDDAHELRPHGNCTLLCGLLQPDPTVCAQLLAGLPSVLMLERTAHLAALQSATCTLLARAPAPGHDAVLNRMAEALLVQAIGGLVDREPWRHQQLLPGCDGIVQRCLALMHKQPDAPWTLQSLACELHTSRSVLAERFASVVGEPPMGYLTRWRLAMAARMLQGTASTLGRVAEAVGYQSEPAFCRAFRRQYGTPPATWRRQQARAPRATQRAGLELLAA